MATPEELSDRYIEMSRSLILKPQEELNVAEDYIQASGSWDGSYPLLPGRGGAASQ